MTVYTNGIGYRQKPRTKRSPSVLIRRWIMPLFFLSILLPSSVAALPLSGSGRDEPKTNTELSKTLFPEEATHKPVTDEDKHYFYIEAPTDLPPLTRVKVELYYVRGKPPLEYLAHREIVRVTDSGHLKTRVLGLRRPLWAGRYKLSLTVNPANQIPEVQQTLNDRLDAAQRRTKTWFYGTKKQRKKQRDQAMKAARTDLKSTLNLASNLKQKLTELLRRRRKAGPSILPAIARLQLARDWWSWSRNWRRRLKQVRERNRRRPRFDGRTISFFEPESSTAYFLAADLKNLQKLYDLAWMALFDDDSPDAARRFQKKYRQVRKSISRTMISLNLVVPLPEPDRKTFRANLKKIDRLMTEMEKILTDDAAGQTPDDDWSTRLQDRTTKLLQILLSLNEDLPDVIYQQFLTMTQRVSRFSRHLPPPSDAREAFRSIHKQFRSARDLSRSFLKSMEE